MARIRGDMRVWTDGLAKLDGRLEKLESQVSVASDQRKHREDAVADLDKSLERKKRILLYALDHQKKIEICRQKIDRITFARQILDKNPAVAYGGLTMVMMAAAAQKL